MQKKRNKAAKVELILNKRLRGKQAPRPAPVPNPRLATAAIDSSEEEKEVAPPRLAKRGAKAVGGSEEIAMGLRKQVMRKVIPNTQEEEEEGNAFTSWVTEVQKDVLKAT
ncbi:hypothetical protein IFR05_009404 [Cadophora sp. M221]|nr:hypothetical protein IFR05_009404 [Cadophora sp. M221]